MTQPTLHIGRSSLDGDLARYARQFDLLEIRAEPHGLPRPSRLREWTTRVPGGFVFSVVLSRTVASLETGDGAERALGYASRAVDALGARWLLLQTPASVTPSDRERRRLERLAGSLASIAAHVAWEPTGLWEPLEAERFAAELGWLLVRDLARVEPPPGEVVYTRVRALGQMGRFGASAAERVAERLAGCTAAYVAIEARDAVRGAQVLRETFSSLVEEDEATAAESSRLPDASLVEEDEATAAESSRLPDASLVDDDEATAAEPSRVPDGDDRRGAGA